LADGDPLASLVAGVELLSLDAGNTIIFLDHPRIARFVNGLPGDGRAVLDGATLVRTEGEAKRALAEPGTTTVVAWPGDDAPGARTWGEVMATMLHRAGVALAHLPDVLEKLFAEHRRFNLYSLVPQGLVEALARIRARGVKVVVVSNSEAVLEPLLVDLGIRGAFDAVLDSGVVGVEKPDPRIFDAALAPFGTPASRALHLGDTFATDVAGARAAGLRAAMIDVHGHYTGLYPDVPRVESVVAVCRAICRETT
jgi:putative hydrolase of the HAD superfamily